mmetsp:Transcript_42286/g.111317  ORF Transcript_42286/g.111317 Transcript_42286/m.111317 type:complete len:233 (+) Transcript_42286:4192-4890(+)
MEGADVDHHLQVRHAPAQAARRRDRGPRAHRLRRLAPGGAPRRVVDGGPVAQDGRLPRVPRPGHRRDAVVLRDQQRGDVLHRALPGLLRPLGQARDRAPHRHDVRVRLSRADREGARQGVAAGHLGRPLRRDAEQLPRGGRAAARRERRARARLARRRHQRRRHGRLDRDAQDPRVPRRPPSRHRGQRLHGAVGLVRRQGGRLLRRLLQVLPRDGTPAPAPRVQLGRAHRPG